MKKLLLILLISATCYANELTCQLDNSDLYWTGAVKTVYGKQLFLYRCLHGHEYWIVNET